MERIAEAPASRQAGVVPALLGLLVLLMACSLQAAPRDINPDALVEVEIATLGMAFDGSPVVLLREPGANRVIPIFIGHAEAQAIALGLRGQRFPRPMTHDLFGNVFGALDATLRRVFVDDLVGGAFLGMLELDVAGREAPVRIDSRPSDALALAVRAGASIHVAPKVLDAAAEIDYRGLDDELVTALGVTVSAVTDELRAALSLPDKEGLLVTDVTGAAAEQGLAAAALLLSVNGETPSSPMHYLELVSATEAGKKARLRVWQDGEEHDIELATDQAPRRRVPPPREGLQSS
ncbi:bifunctional nuclease family protein [Isoalcanivorax indicus]|uniref:bifunctional nuclease family protein n=1 Tax=Isoalcanivorax indicus TaxID=2202653 RepID=UPI000DB93B75|nr:bifunctional nuclease family protein [Isoalcanivorax indicus]